MYLIKTLLWGTVHYAHSSCRQAHIQAHEMAGHPGWHLISPHAACVWQKCPFLLSLYKQGGSCTSLPPFQMCASQYCPSNLFPDPSVNFCLLSVLFESLQIQTLKPSCSDFAWPRSSEVNCFGVSSPVLEPVNEVLQLFGFFFFL